MAEPQTPSSPAVPDQLHEIAKLLRTAHHLGPEAQAALAQLADDLGYVLRENAAPKAESAALIQHVGQLVETLHQDQRTGPLASARQRLEKAMAAVEGRAPYTVGFARQLLDALANLGI